MRRLLNNHWFQAIALPALLAFGAWLGNYLWGQAENGPVIKRVESLENDRSALKSEVDSIKDNTDYMRGRLDEVIDRLPPPTK